MARRGGLALSGRESLLRPTPEQRAAADPAGSFWVDANAGTGKTSVLSDRVLRLLLAGTDPGAILCLTYTKAAATEMLQRVGARLSRWAALDDSDLAAELAAIDGAAVTAGRLARARSLHDAVLALPGGLALMTVHGLCQHLLRRFPLEAGVPAGFDVIDERTKAELLHTAREAMLSHSLRDPDTASDLATLAAAGTDATVLDAVDALIAARLAWERSREVQGTGGFEPALARALGVDPALDPDALRRAACGDGAFDATALAACADALGGHRQKTRVRAAAALRAWLSASEEERVQAFERHVQALTTRDGAELRAGGHLHPDKIASDAPEAAAALAAEIARLAAVDAALRAQMVFARTRALLRLAGRVIEAFERAKAQQAVLDFDDLLLRTRALLAAPGAGEWVRFKLDQAFRHILVDEAQDTNPLQWSIIELLLDEVFAGEGIRGPGARTLFVVGDAKQSIFRFQGAEPEVTATVRHRIEARADAAGTPVLGTSLTTSFRSSQAVLDVVDALLAQPEVATALGASPSHCAFEASRGGRVELWPLLDVAAPAEQGDAWAVPPEPRQAERAERRLARQIAQTLAHWLDEGKTLSGSGRPLRAGDVMVLLRQRGRLQELLVRALKQAGVPVMGADRLPLGEHLAVQDLVALGEAVLLAENDFALACVLKSPLFGLDEEALFALAHGRERGQSLQERLRRRAGEDGALAVLWERFLRWQRLADFVPVHEFYLRVLGGEVARSDGAEPFCGRRALLARFGDEAADAIDAFVEQTLVYEKGHAATLQGFLDWLGRGEPSVKREAAPGGDGVRVMTVHAAKGLEAPLVILADAGPRGMPRTGRLLWCDETGLVYWRPKREEAVEATQRARRAEEAAAAADDLRLLYVAATRAAEWLVVCGTERRAEAQQGSWHARLAEGLASLGATVERLPAGIGGEALVHARGIPKPAESPADDTSIARPAPACLGALPRPAARAPTLRPSDAVTTTAGGADAERVQARAVGAHVHALLERLPALPVSERERALGRYLAQAADLEEGPRMRVRTQVLEVLAAPELAPLFAPDAWAEQPIAGRLDGVRVSGRVDRMALVGDELWLCDFKTGCPPADPAAMPEAYARQLAAYASLAAPLFPAATVRARLVWTETGLIQTLDETLCFAHKSPARR